MTLPLILLLGKLTAGTRSGHEVHYSPLPTECPHDNVQATTTSSRSTGNSNRGFVLPPQDVQGLFPDLKRSSGKRSVMKDLDRTFNDVNADDLQDSQSPSGNGGCLPKPFQTQFLQEISGTPPDEVFLHHQKKLWNHQSKLKRNARYIQFPENGLSQEKAANKVLFLDGFRNNGDFPQNIAKMWNNGNLKRNADEYASRILLLKSGSKRATTHHLLPEREQQDKWEKFFKDEMKDVQFIAVEMKLAELNLLVKFLLSLPHQNSFLQNFALMETMHPHTRKTKLKSVKGQYLHLLQTVGPNENGDLLQIVSRTNAAFPPVKRDLWERTELLRNQNILRNTHAPPRSGAGFTDPTLQSRLTNDEIRFQLENNANLPKSGNPYGTDSLMLEMLKRIDHGFDTELNTTENLHPENSCDNSTGEFVVFYKRTKVRSAIFSGRLPWSCPTITRWRDLGTHVFPRYIQETICDANRTSGIAQPMTCWYGNYDCRPNSVTVPVMVRHSGNCNDNRVPLELRRRYFLSAVEINTACICGN